MTEESGVLEIEDKAYFGGTYSFLEKLRMSGTGSPKILYGSGVPAFDEMDNGLESEVSFVSFELLRDGLIARLNRNQRYSCAGVRLSDIQQISFTAYQVESRGLNRSTRISLRGDLEILEWDQTRSRFSVFPQNFPSFLKFLKKKELAHVLTYMVSDNPPEKDYISIEDFFNRVLRGRNERQDDFV